MEHQLKKISNAIEISINPETSQNDRLEAYNFLEKSKADVGLMVKYGIQLCKPQNSTSVRHFGLQMIEDTIKFHWNNLKTEEKVYIRDRVMDILEYGTLSMLKENMHIKDQVSRLVVEMVKREWPQNWGSFLAELNALAEKGTKQTELVLLILLRLSEDVATLRNFKNTRRQEVYKSLTQVMDSIFNFYFSLLEKHYEQYLDNPENTDVNKEHCRIIQLIFMTFASYVEWVVVKHIFAQAKFFIAIETLIVDPNLSLHVIECLKQIILRRDRLDDQIAAQLLFDKNIFQAIICAADKLSTKPVLEQNYLIVKGLSQVIANVGYQMASVWGKDDISPKEPAHFDTYLNALLAFSSHPSALIYYYTKDAWKAMLRNDKATKTDAFIKILPEWMRIAFSRLIKSGYPSHTGDETSLYSRLDCDSDAEYQKFYANGIRADTLDCLKYAVRLRPDVYFALVRQGIEKLLITPLPTAVPTTEEEMEFGSPLANEWTAIAAVTEILMQTMWDSKNFALPIDEGVTLLAALCQYQSEDPLIALAVVESISGMTCFLPKAPHLVQPVLTKIFETVAFTGEPEPKFLNYFRAKKNLKRFSSMVLTKLLRKHGPLIIPTHYDFIESAISRIVCRENCLVSSVECTILVQARLTLTKSLQNVEAFDAMMDKSFTPIRQKWIDLRPVINSPELLLTYIGVGNEDLAMVDEFTTRRRFIMDCISHIMAVLKSVDPRDKAEDYPPKFVEELRRIVFRHVLPMLVTMYTYCRSYHGMWSEEVQGKLSPVGKAAFELSTKETSSLIKSNFDIQTRYELYSTPIEKIKTFLFGSHDTMCVVLGSTGMLSGSEYYQMPNVVEYSILAPLYNLKNLPNTRVRHILKSFIKTFCVTCPAEQFSSVLIPILNHLCPTMLELLNDRWQILEADAKSESDEEDPTAMLRDMLIRYTARDYIYLLRILLLSDSTQSKGDTQDSDAPAIDIDMDSETMQPSDINSSGNAKISSIGKLMISVDSICHAVVSSLLQSLLCRDSVCVRKAAELLLVCVEAMAEDHQEYLNDEVASLFLSTILRSINIHGEHEVDRMILVEAGTKLYILLRPKFNAVRDLLAGFGALETIDRLDTMVLDSVKQYATFKPARLFRLRKECFETIIQKVIGKNVGEQFKKEVHIADLPPMFSMKKRTLPTRLDETSSDLSLCALFDCTET